MIKKLLCAFSLCAVSLSYGMNEKLYQAIENDDLETVQILLQDPTIDVNQLNNHGNTPLYLAGIYHKVPIINALLNHKNIEADKPNQYGQTILNWAVEHKDYALLHTLLNREDVDINAAATWGDTAFLEATAGGDKFIFQKLIQYGADTNHENKNGSSAYLKASYHNHGEIAEYLAEKEKKYQEFLLHQRKKRTKKEYTEFVQKNHRNKDLDNDSITDSCDEKSNKAD